VRTLFRLALSTPVTLLSTAVTGRDEYGNDVRESTETPVDAIAVWPRESDEVTQGRDTVFVGVNVLLPFGTTVHATDRLRYDDKVWEIDGEPGSFGPSPLTGNVACVEVKLRRVEG
jgi:head-tail adaptor